LTVFKTCRSTARVSVGFNFVGSWWRALDITRKLTRAPDAHVVIYTYTVEGTLASGRV
jgi:hypothetical protein